MSPLVAGHWRRFAGPAIVLLAAALATAPILLHGPYCGDDFEFHVVSWFDAQHSWRQGILYPHWMPSANYGAGEPRFVFYPPLTWMLGAALGLVLPWTVVPVALIFLLLAATGIATRALARQALSDAPATLAGCAALFSGYALFTAYERAAFAELSGGFWIPLLLLFVLSPHRQRPVCGDPGLRDRNPSASLWRRALDGSALPLALVLAGAWLSDAPVGVMASYLLAAVALAAALLARSWAPILRASVAAGLGCALPAVYLVPAAWEQRWVDLREAIDYPIYWIENNWLFARHTDPLLRPFGMVLHRASILAISMIGVAVLSVFVLCLRRSSSAQITHEISSRPEEGGASANRPPNDAPQSHSWWVPLALVPAAVLFLQLPVSLPVWDLLPKLRFLQYPWRWLVVLEAPMAILFAAAVWPGKSARRWQRGAVAACCALFFLTASIFAARAFLRVCKEGDTVPDLLTMYRHGGGFEGTDEYEPAGAEHWMVPTGLPDACLSDDYDARLGVAGTPESIPTWRPEQGSCEATATAQLRQPEHMRIAAVTPHAGFLILHLLSYPAWQVKVNGRLANNLPRRADGLIAVPVPRGPVDLTVDWITTPDVIAGRCLSSLALLLLIALGLLERKLSRPRLS